MVSLNIIKRRGASELVLNLSKTEVDELTRSLPVTESKFSTTMLFDVEGTVAPYVHIVLRPSTDGSPLMRNSMAGFQIALPGVECESYEDVAKSLVLRYGGNQVTVAESEGDETLDKRVIDISEDDVIKVFRDAGDRGLTFNELSEVFPTAKREWIVRRLYEVTNRNFGGVVASKERRATNERSYAGTKVYYYSTFAKAEGEAEDNGRNSDLRPRLSKAIFDAGEEGITSFQLRMMFPEVKTHSLYPSLTRLSKKGLINKLDDGSYRWVGGEPVEAERKSKEPKKERACGAIYAYLDRHPDGADGWTIAENIPDFNVVQIYTSLSSLNNLVYDGGKYFSKTAHPNYVASQARRSTGVPVKQFLRDVLADGVTSQGLIERSRNLNFVSVMVTIRAMMAHREAAFDGEVFRLTR